MNASWSSAHDDTRMSLFAAALDTVPRDMVWNWPALGQHHGLPTRLLDWTFSPYVALQLLARPRPISRRSSSSATSSCSWSDLRSTSGS